ncbi:MAG: tRNA (5-methylaminomethyl-2-thiouridine)(34)-methyltransferase MnmD [Alphaproteobacteria bacterium]|jgi:tRNA U34 5-methylaminomethyl-2-thiouridine-forming methyltransferase MnmC|nr:tRNA (5-methylaminomethyl-2-thiouridine)(34)-methyltransferase MnmD [Alphaproteobacteria bacterium]MBU1548833.1 tRNA (5-methylaminomethyl-2-thiouridine)(34)-methyltransferase MnmD [Alphaproteobacteria bacterium]MBU2335659.1 tRNA (5-methylaminomethyl-2-thiouridine)(34)-methyltransferase MnmD [Alphaproteobacteria bacterium]MBU2390946.1 tRNA (5-methylaminomethyl-2-thiouridine)(34)-methyltransferase MnmD [Alphaproteobacteria bacterium]
MNNDISESDGGSLEWHEGDMPYSPQFGDHFYCRNDGRLECGHVFLAGNGLPEQWHDTSQFRIGELGFGTGLNFCETWRQWKLVRQPGAQLHFTSFELYPMGAEEIGRALSQWPEIAEERTALVAAWPAHPQGRVDIEMDAQTRLTVIVGPALDGVTAEPADFDAWFLDGFAPSRNPDMWSPDLMQAIFDRTVPGGSFATYAAAGFVRRNLQAAGFAVERRPGFAGKREMLCGRK